jgi:hypothetical protein
MMPIVRTQQRHCERSEAIHLTAERKNGLLRFARNDVDRPSLSTVGSYDVTVALLWRRLQGTAPEPAWGSVPVVPVAKP